MENSHLADLRAKHPTFTFKSFDVKVENGELRAQLHYHIDPDLDFTTVLTFANINQDYVYSLDPVVIQQWVFQIGMVEGLSYWKATCSPEFIIEAGYLNEQQLSFWKNLLQKGLSEFFFINQIDGWQDDFVTFVVKSGHQLERRDTSSHQDRVIVPMGGGKDSVVSFEILAKAGEELATLTIEPTDQVLQLLKVAEQKHQKNFSNILINRVIDPQIKKLNVAGYLNGHTPFSAMAAFVTTFAAYLSDYRYVAVSNEFSANEGNTEFLGQTINHQYSKTLEFEQLFREYCRQYLSETIEYFSYLRPFHELQIAQIFAQYPEYFFSFLSCNKGHYTGRWCGECAKCLFVYTMLSPFVKTETLIEIWGKDLFADEKLQPILEELAGVIECKSFDCVGTREETLLALYLTVQKRKTTGLPVLLSYAQERLLSSDQDWAKRTNDFLATVQDDHCVPAKFFPFLLQALKDTAK